MKIVTIDTKKDNITFIINGDVNTFTKLFEKFNNCTLNFDTYGVDQFNKALKYTYENIEEVHFFKYYNDNDKDLITDFVIHHNDVVINYHYNLYDSLKENRLREIFGDDYDLYMNFNEDNYKKLCINIEEYSDYKKWLILTNMVDKSSDDTTYIWNNIIPNKVFLKRGLIFVNTNTTNITESEFHNDGFDDINLLKPF